MNNYNINQIEIFNYVLIVVTCMTIFSYQNININTIFGFIIGTIIIYYLYSTSNNIINYENNILNTKKEKLILNNKNIIKDNKIINYLFSIQEFYYYNPQAYLEFISRIEKFIILYNEVLKDNKTAGINFELMEDEKNEIIKSLSSIIYKLDHNKELINKLNNSVYKIENF